MISKPAPNPEMKKSAVQARKCTHEAIEKMLDNEWSKAREELTTAIILLKKLEFDEASYASLAKETKRRQAEA